MYNNNTYTNYNYWILFDRQLLLDSPKMDMVIIINSIFFWVGISYYFIWSNQWRRVMKTISTELVNLEDGMYLGIWSDKSVTVPFTDMEITFKVKDYVPGKAHDVWVDIKGGVALVLPK